jgi:IPTL-CTERM motif
MNNSFAQRFFCVVIFAFGAVASGLTEAQTTTSYPVSASCSGSGQLCDTIATIPITTTGLLQAQFVGGAALCSNIRIHFLVDGAEVALTGFVGASGSTGFFNLGPVSSGSHTLGLQAEGQVGGCNSGTLGSWAGTAQVTTSAAIVAGQPIPTLSDWALAVLLTLVGFVAVLHIGGNARRTRSER